MYRAETIACALASELASAGDEIMLDNQGVVKATPMRRKGLVKDQDYRDIYRLSRILNETTHHTVDPRAPHPRASNHL